MPDPTVTDDEGTVSEDGLMTNPIFAIPADVGDIAYCRVIPPDGYEWVSGALTIPAIQHVSLSTNGIDWNADNTSLTINELISYPSGKMVFFRINSASSPAPSFILPSDGLTVAVGNAVAGSFAASTAVVGAVTAWQTASGAVAALAAATANVQVTGQKTAEGFVAALARIYATTVNIYQFLPTTLSSRTAGNGSFTVTVDAMDNVSRYDIRYKKWGTVTWTEVSDVGTGTEQVTGLENGFEYQIQNRTWNSGTAGGWGAAGELGTWYSITPVTDSAAGSIAAAAAVTGAASNSAIPVTGSVAAATAVTGAATVAVSLTTYTETRYLHNDTDSTITSYYELLTSQDSDGTIRYASEAPTFPEPPLDSYESSGPALTLKLYKRTSGGTETLLASETQQQAVGGSSNTFSLTVSETAMNATDRIVLKIQPAYWGYQLEDVNNLMIVDIETPVSWVTEELGAAHLDAGTITATVRTNQEFEIRVGSSTTYQTKLTNFVWSG